MFLKIIVAYFLDLLIGDPRWFPHPVKGMGRLIVYIEKWLRRTVLNRRTAGVILAIVVVSSIYLIAFFTVHLAERIGKWAGFIVESFLIFTTFSIKDLGKETDDVYQALNMDDLELARRKLSMIVGRNTENLSKDEIIRATVETIAENSVDGVISPLFYAALGGAPLVLAYKAISTLDSMVGYKNEKYLYFGWFSAKLDDVANYIPARISVLLIPIASFILKERALGAWRSILQDGNKSPSPNAGLPEAGFAGALGIQLGGVAFYQGKRFYKPLIGEKIRQREGNDIPRAVHLMYALSTVAFSGEVAILWYFQSLF